MVEQCKAFCSAASYQMKPLYKFFKEINPTTEIFGGAIYVPISKGSVFFFSYGCVVFWNLSDNEIAQIFKKIKSFENESLEALNEEVYNITEGSVIKVHLNEICFGKENGKMEELSVSHALAQSMKLLTFEERVTQTIKRTEHIPKSLAKTGDITLSGKDIAKEMGDERKVARSFLNMAKVHIKQGKSEMGIKLLNSSQALYSKLSYEKGLLFVHLTKSDYYLNNNLNLAKSEAESALQLAEALGLNQEKLIALKNLEEVMSKRNSYTQAYSYANKHYKLKNEIESKEHLSRIYSYEISSQLDQKNDELITLKRNQVISEIKRKKSINERNFFIVICVLAFLLALLLMYRYNEKKRFVEEYFASDTGVIMKTGKKLLFENIYRVETLRNDLIVIMNQGKITEKSTTLKAFSTNLPKIIFGRPQRGIILNFNYIDKVQKTKVTFQGESINISPKYGEEFLEQWERFLETRKA